MSFDFLQNKVVWITGASSGIGKEAAKQAAASGAFVVLSARNVERLEEVKNSLQNQEMHMILPLDLEKSGEFEGLKNQILDKYGRIDVLFNNGGISQRAEAFATPLEVDRKIMETNYFGNIALTKVVLPVFHKQNEGRIIVISSIAGKFGFYLRSAYSASKHALHGFYESLQLEEAKNNIHITIACPGKINTPISLSALNEQGEAHGVMDHNQATGMPVDECIRQLYKAAELNRREVLIGNKEIKALTLKRFFPKLFWKIIKKQSAT